MFLLLPYCGLPRPRLSEAQEAQMRERLAALTDKMAATEKVASVATAVESAPNDSERAAAVARLVAQVEAMVKESGDPTGFDAAKWFAAWLEQPLPAFGGKTPASYMDTAEGQAIVSNILARMQSGAFA
ncbi:MAG: MbcA/ParS/Xre antitoxin family protein [Ramlibacter sp.]